MDDTAAEGPDTSYAIGPARFSAPRPEPGLYVVATPIGNLGDITVRALEILAGADLVLCEDTRMSARLLDAYRIHTPMSPLHEHNERARIEGIVGQLRAGKAIALISDAGTPLVSDPGFPLVRAAGRDGLPVHPVPGASALLAGLVAAGLPTDRFTFIGFLPPKAGARANAIAEIAQCRETMVFYESPRRLGTCLRALSEGLGDERESAVMLELTKRFERVARGTLGEIAERFAQGPEKGEAVIVVAGASGAPVAAEDWNAALDDALADKPLRAAVDEITARFGLKRKEVYNAALARKKQR